LGPKTRNRAAGAQFQVRRVKRQCRVMRGDGWVVWMRWWWWGSVFANTSRGRDGGQNIETEHDSSVSGVLCQMAVEGNVEMCWCGVNEVVTAVRCCVQ
jgi:hypothetical protein